MNTFVMIIGGAVGKGPVLYRREVEHIHPIWQMVGQGTGRELVFETQLIVLRKPEGQLSTCLEHQQSWAPEQQNCLGKN